MSQMAKNGADPGTLRVFYMAAQFIVSVPAAWIGLLLVVPLARVSLSGALPRWVAQVNGLLAVLLVLGGIAVRGSGVIVPPENIKGNLVAEINIGGGSPTMVRMTSVATAPHRVIRRRRDMRQASQFGQSFSLVNQSTTICQNNAMKWLRRDVVEGTG